MIAGAALALLSVVLLLTTSEPTAIAWLGLLIIWISALPGLLYLAGWLASPMPFMPYVGMFYFLFFGLPVFLAPYANRLGESVVLYTRVVVFGLTPEVLLLVAGGIGSMVLAFYLSHTTIWRRVPAFRLVPPSFAQYETPLYWGLLLTSLAYRLSPPLQSIPSIGQFFEPAAYVALGGFYLQWHAGRMERRQALILLFIFVPLELFVRFRFFLVTDIALLLIFFAFLMLRCGQVKRLAVIVAGVLFVASMYSVTSDLRVTGASFTGKIASVVPQAIRIFEERQMLRRHDSVRPEVMLDRRFTPLVHRISTVWLFQAVYDRTPDPVPYLDGATYRPLLTSLVPRVVFPDKPEERAGGMFGARYGFLGDDSGNTSVNIPWLIELFINFGPNGVILGMAIFGLFLAFLDRVFNRDGMNDLEFLIGLTLIFRLGYQESNFTVMTGSLPLLFAALYLYFRFGPSCIAFVRTALARH